MFPHTKTQYAYFYSLTVHLSFFELLLKKERFFWGGGDNILSTISHLEFQILTGPLFNIVDFQG